MEEITTGRLTLKKIKQDDYTDLYKIWNDRELIKYTYHVYTETIEDCKKRVQKVMDWYSKSGCDFGPFLIYNNKKFVGYCGLDYKSESLKEFELFYIFTKENWNKGFGTEVSRKLTGIAFKKLGAERVAAEAVKENTGSWKILEKIGMTREGCLRRKFYKGEHFHDLFVYSILKDEWLIYRE